MNIHQSNFLRPMACGEHHTTKVVNVICPHCHQQVPLWGAIWLGVKGWARKCAYSGLLLLSIGQTSLPREPQSQPEPPDLIDVRAPSIYTNTSSTVTTISFDKRTT